MKLLKEPFVRKNIVYVGICLLFLFFVTFIDRSNIINQLSMIKEIRQIQKETKFFETELEKIKNEEASVFANKNSVEAYAREKYMMKKEGETVFVLVDEDDQPLKEKK